MMKRIGTTLLCALACLALCLGGALAQEAEHYTLALPEYGATFLLTQAQDEALNGGQYVLTIDDLDAESNRFTYLRFVAYYLDQQALAAADYTMDFLYEKGVHVYDLVIVREDLLATYAPAEDAQVTSLGQEGNYVFQARTYAVDNVDGDPILDMMVADGQTLSDWVVLTEPTIMEDVASAEINSFSMDGALDIFGGAVPEDLYARSTLTMVNIWGTFCSPCVDEMPDLGELAKAYDAARFQIIGVVTDVDSWEDSTAELARAIVEMTGADYLHVVPTMEMLYESLAGVQYIPTTLFVAADGSMVGEATVGSRSKDSWAALIEERLAMVEGAE